MPRPRWVASSQIPIIGFCEPSLGPQRCQTQLTMPTSSPSASTASAPWASSRHGGGEANPAVGPKSSYSASCSVAVANSPCSNGRSRTSTLMASP